MCEPCVTWPVQKHDQPTNQQGCGMAEFTVFPLWAPLASRVCKSALKPATIFPCVSLPLGQSLWKDPSLALLNLLQTQARSQNVHSLKTRISHPCCWSFTCGERFLPPRGPLSLVETSSLRGAATSVGAGGAGIALMRSPGSTGS